MNKINSLLLILIFFLFGCISVRKNLVQEEFNQLNACTYPSSSKSPVFFITNNEDYAQLRWYNSNDTTSFTNCEFEEMPYIDFNRYNLVGMRTNSKEGKKISTTFQNLRNGYRYSVSFKKYVFYIDEAPLITNNWILIDKIPPNSNIQFIANGKSRN